MTKITVCDLAAQFWNNAHYHFSVPPVESGSSATRKVVVSLLQNVDRYSDHKKIGFRLYQVCLSRLADISLALYRCVHGQALYKSTVQKISWNTERMGVVMMTKKVVTFEDDDLFLGKNTVTTPGDINLGDATGWTKN